LDRKPRVEAGPPDIRTYVIGALDSSLATWTLPNGKKETYAFEVEQPSLVPNLAVMARDGKTNAKFTWDPITFHVLTDGVWKYTTTPGKTPKDLPKISRINDKGQEEFIAVDNMTGVEETKTMAGGHQIRTEFSTPGPLYGRLKEVQTVDENGIKSLVLKYDYDEKGRLLRRLDKNGFTHLYLRDEKSGNVTETKLLPPMDPKAIQKLKDKESVMLKKLADLDPKKYPQQSLAWHQLMLDLGRFYLLDMHAPDRVPTLLEQMTDPKYIYRLKMVFLSENRNLTIAQKKAALNGMLKEYSEQSVAINFTLKQLREPLTTQ
jgi:hypothetical protein